MKKILFVSFALILLFSFSSGSFAQDIVKFGISEPMTGAMAVGGELCMQGYELAHEQNPTVLGKQVELVLVDNKSDKVEAANAVSRLIERDNVVAVFVGYGSSMAIPGGEVADKAGIPMLSASATNPLVTQGKDYVFRACFLDPIQGEVMARYTYNDLGIKRAALLVDIAQDYSVGLANFYKRTFESLGGQIVSDVKYNTGDQDFSAQLSQIINSGAEALFFPGYFGDVALIAIQGRELGYTGQFLGGDTLHNPTLIELAGEAAEDLIASTFFVDDEALLEANPE
ncbi:MAG: ABC transporter substrate-binding protein, partial [Atribacterota bacterium]|nr:ABC transporter substrate-binding protein [Atribacterota bacterium]